MFIIIHHEISRGYKRHIRSYPLASPYVIGELCQACCEPDEILWPGCEILKSHERYNGLYFLPNIMDAVTIVYRVTSTPGKNEAITEILFVIILRVS